MKKNMEKRLVKVFENLCKLNFAEDGSYRSPLPYQKNNQENESRVIKEMAAILNKLSKSYHYRNEYKKAVEFLPKGYRARFDSLEDKIEVEKRKEK